MQQAACLLLRAAECCWCSGAEEFPLLVVAHAEWGTFYRNTTTEGLIREVRGGSNEMACEGDGGRAMVGGFAGELHAGPDIP